jgi:hypothetical protein
MVFGQRIERMTGHVRAAGCTRQRDGDALHDGNPRVSDSDVDDPFN